MNRYNRKISKQLTYFKGYSGDGWNCTDTDECLIDTHNCHPNANCTNFEELLFVFHNNIKYYHHLINSNLIDLFSNKKMLVLPPNCTNNT